MYTNLITTKQAPDSRQAMAPNGMEDHFQEAGVMLAFAMYLLDCGADCREVTIHPDGEHGKRFDIQGWLAGNKFTLIQNRGTTKYAGIYERGNQRIIVALTPGKGDVIGKIGSITVAAECKGGVINSRHAGQKSRLRRGLCEAIGLLMTREALQGERHIAVVPRTEETEKLAKRVVRRADRAGIEIALVDSNGEVRFMNPGSVLGNATK